MTADEMNARIRAVIGEHARLAVDAKALGDDSNLYDAGMTSHASVNLMLGLESSFDIEFPERMLRRRAFESVSAIRAALVELTGSGG